MEQGALTAAERIELGEAPALRLGEVAVLPSLRTLRRGDGAEQVIEPRVMQVLIALAEAGGGVVTRDMLTRRCWEGRVVGEDAINRVISRLRRTAEDFCGGAFQIETVTKVGYRLVGDGIAPTSLEAPRRSGLGRRALIGGGVAAVAVAASGLWLARRPAHAVPVDVATFVDQGMAAMREQSDGGYTRAVNLLRHVVDVRPDYADGWGLLACGYAVAGRWRGPPFDTSFAGFARSAAARAEQLDSGNRLGRAGLALLLTRQGNQLRIERELRAAILDHPDNDLLLGSLAGVMMSVGRCREAAALLDRALLSAPPSIGTLYSRVQALWAAGRLGEADRAIEQVYAMYPTDITVWFTRFYLLLHTGRAEQALAQGRSIRPQGVPADNIELVMVAAQAAATRAPADVDEAMRVNLAAAHRGAGFAENTMQFAATLGRIDAAFDLAMAYYFGEGFVTGEARFPPMRGGFTPQNARRTHLLFMPSTVAMRGDARFDRVVERLGLKRYWAEAGVGADYLSS